MNNESVSNNGTQTIIIQKSGMGPGILAGIFACVFAVLGILTIAILFIPLAFITACFGTFFAIKNRNIAGIGVNILAWLLIIVGVMVSPTLLTIIFAIS